MLQIKAAFARSERGSVEGIIVNRNGFMKALLRCTRASSKEPNMSLKLLSIDPRLAELTYVGERVGHNLAVA